MFRRAFAEYVLAASEFVRAAREDAVDEADEEHANVKETDRQFPGMRS